MNNQIAFRKLSELIFELRKKHQRFYVYTDVEIIVLALDYFLKTKEKLARVN